MRVLYKQIAESIVKHGYQHAEYSWVVDDNIAMNKAAKWLGGSIYKTYKLFSKRMSEAPLSHQT